MNYHREGELGDCEYYVTANKKCWRKPAKFYYDSGNFQCEFHRNNMHYTASARKSKKPIEDIKEAQSIVLDVWTKMVTQWKAEHPWAAPWFMSIKKGYRINRKFYNALETVARNPTEEWNVHFAGAPSVVCQNEGVRIHDHNGVDKIFVYYELVGKDMKFYNPRIEKPT